MIMKRIILILPIVLLFVLAKPSFAQQDPLKAHYMLNQLLVNPSYAGSSELISLDFTSRIQWVGLEGAPQTYAFSVHTPYKHQLGFGLSLQSDIAGPLSNTGFKISASYHVLLDKNIKLYAGLSAGMNNVNAALSSVEGVQVDDPAFYQNINRFKPVFGAGLYAKFTSGFVGFSVPSLLNQKYTVETGNWTYQRHAFLMGGYLFDIHPDFKLRSMAMTRYVKNAPLSIEATLAVIMRDRFWFGLLYRHKDAVGPLFSIQVYDDFRLTYSYDYSITQLRTFQSGSHEVTLTYDIRPIDKSYVSPRYF